MKRPGYLAGLLIKKPKNLGMWAPRMGPGIPGPPTPSPKAPISHPWQYARVVMPPTRNCATC